METARHSNKTTLLRVTDGNSLSFSASDGCSFNTQSSARKHLPKVGMEEALYSMNMFNCTSYVLLLVLSCLLCKCCWLTVCIVVVVLCVLLSYVYLLYYVGIAVFTLDAGLLARSQYSEGPATGNLDTGFSRFPCA